MLVADEDPAAFRPFLREDAYGEGAEAPFSLAERARLALMTVLVLPFKAFATLLCVVGCFLTTRAAQLFPEPARSHAVAAGGSFWARGCLAAFGFWRVRWVRVDPEKHGATRPVAIVSNHMSYLDILLHMARSFPSFVARDGTQNIPMIGVVAQAMNCIYVNREKRAAAQPPGSSPAANGNAVVPPVASNGAANGSAPEGGVAAAVVQRMRRLVSSPAPGDRPMLLFPEGTTSNGSFLLPFKTGAFIAGLPVQPVIIRYNYRRISPAWDTIGPQKHIYLMLCCLVHSVTCYELPPYEPNEEEKKSPALFAANVRRYMLQYSGLKAAEATLEDKRRYQKRLTAAKEAEAAATAAAKDGTAAASLAERKRL